MGMDETKFAHIGGAVGMLASMATMERVMTAGRLKVAAVPTTNAIDPNEPPHAPESRQVRRARERREAKRRWR